MKLTLPIYREHQYKEPINFSFLTSMFYRWPVVYFGSNPATAHKLYNTFWKCVDLLDDLDVILWITLWQTVHPQTAYLLPCCFQGIPAIPVGSSRKFTSTSRGCASSKMHVFKKIRNNIESSKCIVWEHWEECFKFNFQNGFFYTQQTYGGAHQFNPFK